ncbi:recombinase family protein [Leifsonia aquatica]|uniref:recombinase family protein n=1 Tax=Leifsonia aquatica TaxID=144185 RepID=UPI0038144828
MNTVIGYTRVSTEEQGRSGLGLDAQRAAIVAHAEAKGWKVVWHTDEGKSAKSLDRPALQTALAALRRGEAEAIVVAKLDRLSRSMQDFSTLFARAKRERWSLIAIDLGVDTTTATGKLVANVMGSVAEWEREIIGERTSAALKAAQARGIKVGRPRALSRDAEVRLYELRALGLSFAKVATQLNTEHVATAHGGAWQASTVARILNRAA